MVHISAISKEINVFCRYVYELYKPLSKCHVAVERYIHMIDTYLMVPEWRSRLIAMHSTIR